MLPTNHADALRLSVSGTETEHFAVAGTIPGVQITAAAGRNGAGVGRLRNIGATLYWQAPGSNDYGPGVITASDGTYLLEDGEDRDAWLRVSVTTAYLLDFAEAAVNLDVLTGNHIADADVTAAEAAGGDVHTYTITLTNASTFALSQLVVWIDPDTSGLEISDDGAAWVSPTTEAAGLALPNLSPSATDTLHIRRTIAAGAEADPNVLNHLHLAFCGI